MKGAERIYVYPEFTHSCTERGKGDIEYIRADLAIERLARIMITFDLATGHADTMDDLLDSLESELRDVLGYYREALRNANKETAKEKLRLRRGDTVICIESNEHCLVWTCSIEGSAWVRFPDGTMGSYTAEQMGQLFSHQQEPAKDEPVVFIRPDHLAKARKSPFLCQVGPMQVADFVPLYLHPQEPKKPIAYINLDDQRLEWAIPFQFNSSCFRQGKVPLYLGTTEEE